MAGEVFGSGTDSLRTATKALSGSLCWRVALLSWANGRSMVEEGLARAPTLFELPLRLSVGLSPGRVALLSLGGRNGRMGHRHGGGGFGPNRPACSATLGETLMRGSSLSPLLPLFSIRTHKSMSRGGWNRRCLPLVGRSGDLCHVL